MCERGKPLQPLAPRDSNSCGSVKPSEAPATPLWGVWELWCDFPSTEQSGKTRRGQLGLTWIDDVKSVGVFDSVEGFWGIHNCLLPLSQLDEGTNLYLLRRNIPPMWEHEANRRGGKWSAYIPLADKPAADALWLSAMLHAVGELFPATDSEICGVTATRRRSGFRVSVWTRTATDTESQLEIGRCIRALIPRAVTGQLYYFKHASALASPTVTSRGRLSPMSEHASPGSPDSRSRSPLTIDTRRSPSPVGSRHGSPPASPLASSPGGNVLYMV
jgi:translation initiation factor 4E